MSTILHVEDDDDTRRLFAAVLGRAGYFVVSTQNGREALTYLQAEIDNGRPLPALVITDLNMPHMNGLQLIAELKSRPALAALPIIALSGSSPTSLHLAALAAPMVRGMPGGQPDLRPGRAGGVVASFVKPLPNDKAFLAMVQQHAGKGGS